MRQSQGRRAGTSPIRACLKQKAGARLPLLAGDSKEQEWKLFFWGLGILSQRQEAEGVLEPWLGLICVSHC